MEERQRGKRIERERKETEEKRKKKRRQACCLNLRRF